MRFGWNKPPISASFASATPWSSATAFLKSSFAVIVFLLFPERNCSRPAHNYDLTFCKCANSPSIPVIPEKQPPLYHFGVSLSKDGWFQLKLLAILSIRHRFFFLGKDQAHLS